MGEPAHERVTKIFLDVHSEQNPSTPVVILTGRMRCRSLWGASRVTLLRPDPDPGRIPGQFVPCRPPLLRGNRPGFAAVVSWISWLVLNSSGLGLVHGPRLLVLLLPFAMLRRRFAGRRGTRHDRRKLAAGGDVGGADVAGNRPIGADPSAEGNAGPAASTASADGPATVFEISIGSRLQLEGDGAAKRLARRPGGGSLHRPDLTPRGTWGGLDRDLRRRRPPRSRRPDPAR